MYYPVAIFCHNRPEHLNKMLTSLGENKEISETNAFFYIDGKKETDESSYVEQTIKIAESCNLFKDKKIIIREKNIGMQKNVISGISEVLETNESVIVLEDDLIFSKYYLEFMNHALNFYKDYENIWHINGWSFPNYITFRNKSSISNQMHSWGMGLFKDKWEVFSTDNDGLKNKVSNRSTDFKKQFNYGNSYNWVEEIEFNFTGRLKTFSCFWYQTIFLNDGLTVYPNKSLIFNTGNDGSGVNSGNNSRMDTKIFNGKIKKLVIPTSYSFFFKLNSKIFYNKNKVYKFFNYHRKKFISLNNFREYLKSKY